MAFEKADTTPNNLPFFKRVNNPLAMRLFLLKTLPAAYFSGLKIKEANSTSCTVTVPYKWFTQNPFRSTYFACLAMAAEMTTGLLAMGAIYKANPPISMLIVAMESKYYKKATDVTSFTCNEGQQVIDVVATVLETDEPQTVKLNSQGFNQAGEMVAEFWFTWSFKKKASAKSNGLP